jgi:hypothetical protein
MLIYSLLVLALVGSTPVTDLIASYKTEAECQKAAVEFIAEVKPKLREDVLAFGAGCVAVKMSEGKPV